MPNNENYPSNSHSKKQEKEMPKLEKVTTGRITKQRKSMSKRMLERFLGEDRENIGDYILYDIVIPYVKDMINKAGSDGLEMLLFGQTGGNTYNRLDPRRNNRNYNKISMRERDIRTSRDSREDRRELSRTSRARHDFETVTFETRFDADTVLERLIDLTESEYGQATVADFYDLIGITGEFTDDRWGWRDLRGARTVKARRGGYILDLPRTEPLN